MTATRPSAPASEAALDSLVRSIVRGEFAAGSRLPAERDLAVRLGTSRPTLREALRRLSEWGLVEARRGAGVTVRPHTDWSIEITPAFLRHVPPEQFGTSAAEFLRGLLALRRGLLSATVPLIIGRLSPAAIVDARAAVLRAWSARGTAEFAAADFYIMKSLVTAAAALPALWLLNRVEGMYMELAQQWGSVAPDDDYIEGLTRFLDCLEAGDGDRAARQLLTYIERNDARLLTLFGASL